MANGLEWTPQTWKETGSGTGILTPTTGYTGALIAMGTKTADAYALNLTGTYNAAGVAFGGLLRATLTNTASAAGSKFFDFVTGVTSVCSLTPAGTLSAVAFSGDGSALTGVVPASSAYTLDPTGFEDCDNVGVSYDYTTRKVTLTHSSGSIYYWWKGTRLLLGASPYTSVAHTPTDGPWYYYISAVTGTTPTLTWAVSSWTFDKAQIAYVYYNAGSGIYFCLREVHGFMEWNTHQELHTLLGTYVVSGFAASAYTFPPTADADNKFAIAQGSIRDEDATTTVPAVVSGAYTTMYLSGAATVAFNTAATLPYTNGATYINYYNPTTGAAVEGAANRYYPAYMIAMPAASDAESQKYRALCFLPQAEYTTLAQARTHDPRTMNYGQFSSIASEFVIFKQIIWRTNASYATTGKCGIEEVNAIVGSKYNNIGVISGASSYLPAIGTSTDTAVAVWSGTLGNSLANTGVLISSTNAVSGAKSLAVAYGAGTDDFNAVTVTGTYNDAADTFTGLLVLTVTDTASAAASAIAKFKVGSSDMFLFRKDGRLACSGLYEAQGTLTADLPPLHATATWNNGAVTFYGVRLEVTNTASAATSRLLSLEVGASPVLYVTTGGSLTATALAATPLAALTASAPGLTVTQTWNNGAVTFEAISVAITDTASAAASWLLNATVGGSTVFGVEKDGTIRVTGGSYAPATNYCEIYMLTEEVTTDAATTKDLAMSIPVGTIILGGAVKNVTAITGAGVVNYSLGTGADQNAFINTGPGLLINATAIAAAPDATALTSWNHSGALTPRLTFNAAVDAGCKVRVSFLVASMAIS